MDNYIKVRIDSSEKLIWEGEAKSVSSINPQGAFDILHDHMNFVTLIESDPITVRVPEGKPLIFRFERAVIYNRNNQVSIYTV